MSHFIQRMKQRAREEGSGIKFRGRHYHQYFEGYSEYCVDLPNGKKKVERIYTGVYYVQELSVHQKILLRISYVLFYVLTAAAFLYPVLQPVPFNTKWFIVLIEAAVIIFMFRLACGLVNYCFGHKRMTAGEYRFSSMKVRSEAFRCGTALAVLAVIAAGYVLRLQDVKYITCAICFIIGSFWMFLMFFIEGKIEYRKEKSENKIPPGGIEISYDL